jgi:hypothetical protein
MTLSKRGCWLASLVLALAPASGWAQQQVPRLELIPPLPVTNKVILDVRGAVENNSDADRRYAVGLYLDRESAATLLHKEDLEVGAHRNAGIYYRHTTS